MYLSIIFLSSFYVSIYVYVAFHLDSLEARVMRRIRVIKNMYVCIYLRAYVYTYTSMYVSPSIFFVFSFQKRGIFGVDIGKFLYKHVHSWHHKVLGKPKG